MSSITFLAKENAIHFLSETMQAPIKVASIVYDFQAPVFFLIRHGETDWNQIGRLQGQGNESQLTLRGQSEAQAVGERLRKQFESTDSIEIWSSDLTRAAQTAAQISRRVFGSDDCVHYHPALREANHGRLSGLLPAEYQQIASYQSYKKLSPREKFFTAMDPEQGESKDRVARRALACFEELAKRGAKMFIVVTHGGVIDAVWSALKQDFTPPKVNNCEGLILQEYPSNDARLIPFSHSSIQQHTEDGLQPTTPAKPA